MKKLILVALFTLILLSIVIAEEFTLNKGETKSIDGKQIKLITATEARAVIEVNGIKKILVEGSTETVEGLELILISVMHFDDELQQATIQTNVIGSSSVDIPVTCGDDICETKERGSCCIDCSCEESSSCNEETNQCIRDQCNSYTECNDNDPCTKDRCKGTPKECRHDTITGCGESKDTTNNEKTTNDDPGDQKDPNNNQGENRSIINKEENKEKESLISKIIRFFINLIK